MKHRRFLLILILLVCGARYAQAQAPVRNGDFEEGPAGAAPVGWVSDSPGYETDVVDEAGVNAGRALRLRKTDAHASGTFGAVGQAVDAGPYRGRRVRLSAWSRVEAAGAGSWSGLWLRAIRPERQPGFFDNMHDRPIRTSEWQRFEIVGDIDADAERLVFGLLLQGDGVAWLDDVVLEILGAATSAAAEPPSPLSERGVANLVAFTRLLGYVQYFHPGDAAAHADWDSIAVAGAREVERAQDAESLKAALKAIFLPLAPGLELAVGREPPAGSSRGGSAVPASSALAWRHRGVGTNVPMGATQIYGSVRVRLPATDPAFGDSLPAIGERFTADIGGGIVAAVPLTELEPLVGDAAPGTSAPQQQPANRRAPAGTFSAADRATRLAAVALAWNVFQHFYPYFDVVAADWHAELRRALTSAATDPDERAFLRTLQLMVAALEDGHGSVWHRSEDATHVPAVQWRDAGGHLVVSVAEHGTGLRPGDTVLRIDGVPAEAAIASQERLVSAATPQWRRYRAANALLVGPSGSSLRLEVRRGDEPARDVTVQRTMRGRGPPERRPAPIDDVGSGIMYVDLERVTGDAFRAALPRLEAARGLVFDLRGYPDASAVAILAHLLTDHVTSAQWHIPVTTRPDRLDMRFVRQGEWNVQPREPRLASPRVFLTDGRAISYAESVMGIVEHYRLGEIVGAATAGTNGNVNPFDVPGGYRVWWTGMKVLKHDGSVHHGVGILPTVPVEPTAEGIAAGRDEVLERALELLRAKRAP